MADIFIRNGNLMGRAWFLIGWLSGLFNIPNLIEIALKHDLKYAYGALGDKAAKRVADLEFEIDLLRDGASIEVAKIMVGFVDVGGTEWFNFDFSWGFAWKK